MNLFKSIHFRGAAACAVALCLLFSAPATAARPIVVLLTDFGTANEAVGLCHGAILAVDPEIEVVDLSHEVTAYDIQQASLMLRGTDIFPAGTVFVTVVDPGVGTSRRAICIRTRKGLFYIGPDNGVLTTVIQAQGVDKAVEIDPKFVNPRWQPGTFDGRDLFSPAAGKLASSKGNIAAIGTSIDATRLVTLPIPHPKFTPGSGEIRGVFLRADEPYGNVWTNIDTESLTSAGLTMGENLRVSGPRGLDIQVPFVQTFGNVPSGGSLAYLNSNSSLSLAINMGDFRKVYKLEPGDELVFRRTAATATDAGTTTSAE